MSADAGRALPRELNQLLTRHLAPPGLKRRVAFMAAQPRATHPAAQSGPSSRAVWPAWRSALAGAACGALLAVLALSWPGLGGGNPPLQQQLVDDHVRSLMADHLTDVPASDLRALSLWFRGKLDYAPPVVVPAEAGTTLTGGRLDWLQGRAVAALVYQRGAHTINVFVRPQSGARASPALNSLRGYQLARWREQGLEFLAVSDLNAQDLQRFAEQLSAKLVAGPG